MVGPRFSHLIHAIVRDEIPPTPAGPRQSGMSFSPVPTPRPAPASAETTTSTARYLAPMSMSRSAVDSDPLIVSRRREVCAIGSSSERDRSQGRAFHVKRRSHPRHQVDGLELGHHRVRTIAILPRMSQGDRSARGTTCSTDLPRPIRCHRTPLPLGPSDAARGLARASSFASHREHARGLAACESEWEAMLRVIDRREHRGPVCRGQRSKRWLERDAQEHSRESATRSRAPIRPSERFS